MLKRGKEGRRELDILVDDSLSVHLFHTHISHTYICTHIHMYTHICIHTLFLTPSKLEHVSQERASVLNRLRAIDKEIASLRKPLSEAKQYIYTSGEVIKKQATICQKEQIAIQHVSLSLSLTLSFFSSFFLFGIF